MLCLKMKFDSRYEVFLDNFIVMCSATVKRLGNTAALDEYYLWKRLFERYEKVLLMNKIFVYQNAKYNGCV